MRAARAARECPTFGGEDEELSAWSRLVPAAEDGDDFGAFPMRDTFLEDKIGEEATAAPPDARPAAEAAAAPLRGAVPAKARACKKQRHLPELSVGTSDARSAMALLRACIAGTKRGNASTPLLLKELPLAGPSGLLAAASAAEAAWEAAAYETAAARCKARRLALPVWARSPKGAARRRPAAGGRRKGTLMWLAGHTHLTDTDGAAAECHRALRRVANGRIFMNRMAGTARQAQKAVMSERLDQLAHLFPETYNGPRGGRFCPRSWVLPRERAEFEDFLEARAGEGVEAVDDQEKSKKKKKKRSGAAAQDTYIVKPSCGSQGEGIALFMPGRSSALRRTASLDAVLDASGGGGDEAFVVQQYVSDALLLGGFKFDLRLYVLITACHEEEGSAVAEGGGGRPIRVRAYICKEGLGRLCTLPYERPTPANLGKVLSHLTNYSLNKNNKEGFLREDDGGGSGAAAGAAATHHTVHQHTEEEDDEGKDGGEDEEGKESVAGEEQAEDEQGNFEIGSKRPLSVIWRQLSRSGTAVVGGGCGGGASDDEGDEEGLDGDGRFSDAALAHCWRGICSLVARTVASMAPAIAANAPALPPPASDAPPRGECFALMGFDVMLDSRLTPHLLEVNNNPSLSIEYSKEEQQAAEEAQEAAPARVAAKAGAEAAPQPAAASPPGRGSTWGRAARDCLAARGAGGGSSPAPRLSSSQSRRSSGGLNAISDVDLLIKRTALGDALRTFFVDEGRLHGAASPRVAPCAAPFPRASGVGGGAGGGTGGGTGGANHDAGAAPNSFELVLDTVSAEPTAPDGVLEVLGFSARLRRVFNAYGSRVRNGSVVLLPGAPSVSAHIGMSSTRFARFVRALAAAPPAEPAQRPPSPLCTASADILYAQIVRERAFSNGSGASSSSGAMDEAAFLRALMALARRQDAPAFEARPREAIDALLARAMRGIDTSGL